MKKSEKAVELFKRVIIVRSLFSEPLPRIWELILKRL